MLQLREMNSNGGVNSTTRAASPSHWRNAWNVTGVVPRRYRPSAWNLMVWVMLPPIPTELVYQSAEPKLVMGRTAFGSTLAVRHSKPGTTPQLPTTGTLKLTPAPALDT